MTTLLDAIHRLDAAVQALAHALVTGDPDRVLAAETPLADAFHLVTIADRSQPVDRAALDAAVGAVRRSITCCRALGASSAEVMTALIPPATYGHSRAAGSARPAQPALDIATDGSEGARS